MQGHRPLKGSRALTWEAWPPSPTGSALLSTTTERLAGGAPQAQVLGDGLPSLGNVISDQVG